MEDSFLPPLCSSSSQTAGSIRQFVSLEQRREPKRLFIITEPIGKQVHPVAVRVHSRHRASKMGGQETNDSFGNRTL